MTTATRITDRCTLHGEGAFWDPVEGRLLLVDMLAGAVVAVGDDGGTTRHELGGIAAVIRRRRGGFVLAVERGFRLLDDRFTPVGEEIRVFDDPALRMNEGGCDPAGRLFVGSMAYDVTPGAGTLWRLDADRAVTPALTGITISNGLQWSADGRSAFHDDTPPGTVSRYDYDVAAGAFGDREVIVRLDEGTGLPDGMAIDAEDGLWVALWGGYGVQRYDRDGRLTARVDLPTKHVTSCAFGGPGLGTLFITTSRDGWGDRHAEPQAGSVFAVDAGVRGAPLPFWAG